MAEGRATRDASNDVIWNEMREQRESRRRNEISKLWSHPRVMKKAYKSDH